jgi:hypothetical protein
MKQLYPGKLILLVILFFGFLTSGAQVTWLKTSGTTGSGNFTISGTGSVYTLNSNSNTALLKHSSSTGAYYTCDNCTINIEITGQLVIDYPLYLTNSHVIVGNTNVASANNTATLFVSGNAANPRQALFLDNASSIQLESSTNYIQLQSSPAAYIYFDYVGSANSAPTPASKVFAGNNNAPLCGISAATGSYPYTCSQGQVNGPSILSGSGFNIIAPLPIVLVDFAGTLNSNKTILLNWSTQVEVNLSYFTIERSADGANWEIIGTVQAVGNAQFASYYSFTDQNPLSGLNYYRLQMTDLDNKSGFTAIEIVRTPIIKLFKVFPNPAKDYVDITLSKATTGYIRLLNQFGQVLQQQQLSEANNGTTLSFQLFSYPTGSYIIQVVESDGTQETGKLIITK